MSDDAKLIERLDQLVFYHAGTDDNTADALLAAISRLRALAALTGIVQQTRATFKVEYIDGHPMGIAYDNEALRPLIEMLDAALSPIPAEPR